MASDPWKNSHARAMVRTWEACVDRKQCDVTDPRIYNFTRLALKK